MVNQLKKALFFNSLFAVVFIRLLLLPQAIAEVGESRSTAAYCSEIIIPQHVSVTTLLNNKLYNKSIVDAKNKVVAYIKQNKTNERFELYDLSNNLILSGVAKKQNTDSEIELKNCQGESIGLIKQDVANSFLSGDTSYIVQDENNNFIFQSLKKEEGSKFISVTDKNKFEVGSLNIQRTDKKYEAKLKNVASGPYALLFLATLKLYADTK